MNTLNQLRRLTSGLLSLALVGSSCTAWLPTAAGASRLEGSLLLEQPTTGSIGLTITFALPQTREAVEDRALQLTLSGPKEVQVPLKEGANHPCDGVTVAVEAQNAQGAPLSTEQQIGAYEVVVSGLPTGS